MHTSLTPTDLQFIVSRLPHDIRDMAKNHRLVIAGGFIRETIAGNQAKDIDVFGPSEDVLKLSAALLREKRDGRLIATKNAITILSGTRMPVQFITRWTFAEPKAVIDSFDFTVCQAAVWYHLTDGWQSAVSAGFYPDLAARRLVYTNPVREEEAGGSMLRVRKFLERGWSIQAPSLASVIARVAAKVRWSEIGQDEARAAFVITGLLREVDPVVAMDGTEPLDDHEQATEEAKP